MKLQRKVVWRLKEWKLEISQNLGKICMQKKSEIYEQGVLEGNFSSCSFHKYGARFTLELVIMHVLCNGISKLMHVLCMLSIKQIPLPLTGIGCLPRQYFLCSLYIY